MRSVPLLRGGHMDGGASSVKAWGWTRLEYTGMGSQVAPDYRGLSVCAKGMK